MEWGKGLKCSTGEIVYNYYDYLLTKHWSKKRIETAVFYKYECQFCHEKNPLKFEIHHKTYKHVGKEKMKDLLFLCEKCHKAYHKNKAIKEAIKQKENPKPIKIKKLPKITKKNPILYICPTCSIALIVELNSVKCLKCKKKWIADFTDKENPVFTGKSLKINPIVMKKIT